jgi:hypothetical protein
MEKQKCPRCPARVSDLLEHIRKKHPGMVRAATAVNVARVTVRGIKDRRRR